MNRIKRNWVSGTCCALGALAMVYGLWREEAAIVLRTAIRVCLECIGIG